jgi:hypothetical protein
MAAEPSQPPSPTSTESVEESASTAARLTISTRPFHGELKGELDARVPAQETKHVLNTIWRMVIASAFAVVTPSMILLLGSGAGLPPEWIAGLTAGSLLLAALMVLLTYRSSASCSK